MFISSVIGRSFVFISLISVLLFSSFASAQQYVAYPDNDPNSGRMVNVSRGADTLGNVPDGEVSFKVLVEVNALSTDPLIIELFDGDGSAGGKWDAINGNGPLDEVIFEVFADPDKNGNTDVANLITSVSSTVMPDNDWGILLNQLNDPRALSSDGLSYFYHVTARWVNPVITNEINNFKIRATARLILPIGVTQGLISYNAAEFDFGTEFSGTERNSYDGTYTFKTIIPVPDTNADIVCHLDLYDGDLDFAFDTDDANSIDVVADNSDNYPPFDVSTATLVEAANPGSPPDGSAANVLTIAPAAYIEVFLPDGTQVENRDVSGDREWELYRILSNDPYCVGNNLPANRNDIPADLELSSIEPGTYFFVVRGVDGRNNVFFNPQFELEPAVLPQSTIGNYVWVDENGDGYQDAGEPGIPNVTVQLTDAEGNTVTTVTDSNGGYIFSGLLPDDYTVSVDQSTLPVGLIQSTNPVLGGADFGNQSQPYAITLSLGETNLTADFGYEYGDPDSNSGDGAIGDYLWIDVDGDGMQDAGEAGFGGVNVEIYYDSNADGVVEPGIDELYTLAVDKNGDTGTGITTTDVARLLCIHRLAGRGLQNCRR